MAEIATDVQLANAAYAAGFRGDDVAVAVAVALAESGGDVDAVGDLALVNATWGPSVGPWQIRSLVAQYGTGGARDEVANRNLTHNASAAYQIWQQSGWRAWSTYVSGAYRLFLGRGKTAAGSKTVNDDGSVPGYTEPTIRTPLDALQSMVSALAHATAWVAEPHNWLRVGYALIGGALVVGGLIVVAKNAGAPVPSIPSPVKLKAKPKGNPNA